MQNSPDNTNEDHKEVDLINTYIESIKYSFKRKPMWKFIVKYLAVANFTLSMLTCTILFSTFYPIILEENVDDLFSNPRFVLVIFGIAILLLLSLIVNFVGNTIVISGSIVKTWGHELHIDEWNDEEKYQTITLRKSIPIFLYRLVFMFLRLLVISLLLVGNPYAFFGNNALITIFVLIADFLLLPIGILISMALSTVFPILMLDNITFKSFITKGIEYLNKNFWKLILARLIAYSGMLLVNIANTFFNQVLSIILQIGIITGAFIILTVPGVNILCALIMGIIVSILPVIMGACQHIIIGVEQNYYTILYCKFNIVHKP